MPLPFIIHRFYISLRASPFDTLVASTKAYNQQRALTMNRESFQISNRGNEIVRRSHKIQMQYRTNLNWFGLLGEDLDELL